ncbi:unannotated protein [freshwater metagenome]|uniref:Unannotated protein n=1 Tax=freshwater metagenome TaxID=449393 RepID=A0A6J7F5J5_9ZZZZ
MPSAVALEMPALPSAMNSTMQSSGAAKCEKCSWPSSGSYRRATEGLYPATITSRSTSKPTFMSFSVQPMKMLFSGMYGNSFTVTSEMKHSAPSLPMTMWRISGPAARRGTFLIRDT